MLFARPDCLSKWHLPRTQIRPNPTSRNGRHLEKFRLSSYLEKGRSSGETGERKKRNGIPVDFSTSAEGPPRENGNGINGRVEISVPRKREEWIPIFALYNFREKRLYNTSKKGGVDSNFCTVQFPREMVEQYLEKGRSGFQFLHCTISERNGWTIPREREESWCE